MTVLGPFLIVGIIELGLAYWGACLRASRAEQQRDQLVHWLQSMGWIVAFEKDKTVIMRDPERQLR